MTGFADQTSTHLDWPLDEDTHMENHGYATHYNPVEFEIGKLYNFKLEWDADSVDTPECPQMIDDIGET